MEGLVIYIYIIHESNLTLYTQRPVHRKTAKSDKHMHNICFTNPPVAVVLSPAGIPLYHETRFIL